MSIEHRPIGIPRRRGLFEDLLTIILPDIKVRYFDTKRSEFSRNITIAPSMEDVTGIGSERDDIPERFECWESFQDDNIVALKVAFDGSGEATETGADDDNFDACLGLCLRVWDVGVGHGGLSELKVRAGLCGRNSSPPQLPGDRQFPQPNRTPERRAPRNNNGGFSGFRIFPRANDEGIVP